MTPVWLGILVTAIGCYALKYAGLSVPDRILDHPLVVKAANLIPVGLLGALICVQVFADNGNIVLDARLLGLVVAAVLLLLRVPFLPMVFGAALAAALARMV
ncbi:MAG: AzlD domain-containing protein [Aeromicrobium sp.]